MAKFANLMDNDIASGAMQKQQGVKKFTYTPTNFVAKPEITPLLTALSTNKTANVKTNTGTNYKPLAVPTSAQKMANVGIDFKPTAQSQINTINGISNKTITPTPIVPANTLLNKVQFVSDKAASGAIGMSKGLVNEIGYLGQGAAQGMYASEAAKLKLADAGNKTVSPVTQSMTETATKLANTPLQNSVEWGKDFDKRITDYGYDNDKTMQTIGNVASGIGGMIPAIISNVIVPGSGLFTMATGAAGNATEEAVKRGADTGSALAYGVAIGVTEAATEKLFNGVAGVFGKGAADDVIKSLAKNVAKNPTTQKAIKMLADTLGEGFEEWLTEYAEAYENKLLINQDSRSFKDISSDALYSAAIGSLVSVVMQGGNIANLSAKSAGEMAANDTSAKLTAQTGANNVQVVPNNMQNQGQNAQKQTLAPNLVNANKANVSVQENVSVPQQAAQPITEALSLDNVDKYVSDGRKDNSIWIDRTEDDGTRIIAERAYDGSELVGWNYYSIKDNKLGTAFVKKTGKSGFEVDDEGTQLANVNRIKSQPVQAPVSDFKPQVATDTAKAETPSVAQQTKPESTIEARKQQFNADIEKYNDDVELWSGTNDANEYNRLKAEKIRLDDEYAAISDATRRANGTVSKEIDAPQNHIDNRLMSKVFPQKMKAFGFDHPQLHKYYSEAAENLKDDIAYASQHSANITAKKTKAVQDLKGAGLSYSEMYDACDRIIHDQGHENIAAAKKVEIALDEMLSDGYADYSGNQRGANGDYIAEKSKIAGGETEADRRVNAEKEADEAADAFDGYTPTADEKSAREAKYNNIRSLFPSTSLGAKITSGMPQGTGAKSAEFGYEEAPTQNRMAENTFTEEEVANTPELENTHKVNPDAYVDRNAQERYDFDYDGEKADLFGKKQSWDDADTKLAIMIIENETAKARESGNPADWINVAKLNKKYAAIGTTWGQEGRQRQRFKNTPTEIIAEAAETLFGEDVRKMSDADKQAVMDTISESADALENTQDGDTGSLIELIKKLNVARRTTGLFSKSTSKKMSSLLEEAAKMDGGFDFLKAVATKQIRNVSADFHKSTGIETVKSIWYQNMLSKLVTFARNVVSNTYTDISETFATDVVVPLDILVSKLTGTRAIPVDLSWVSEAKRKGAKEGFIKSAIQVALDADTRDVNSKYGTNAGRTFKMSGSPIERFFSTWAKWESYGLVSTDEFAKGGTSAETQRGIDKLKGRGLIAQDAMQDRATEVAKQRTFQNEGAAAKVSTGVKSALDYVGVKDKKGNRFGLGTLTNPFPLIPANIASMGAQGTPAGLVMNGIKNLGKMLYAAKNGTLTPEMQAQALTELGRGLVGSAGVAMLTALAIKGVIKTFGDDDKDKEAQQRAEGMNGTQFNIDALIRLANGEDTKWRESDTLVNIGFLETLNAQMATAALIAEDYNSADKKVSLASVVQDSFSGVVQTTLELPALQSIQEIMNGYKYSDSEKAGGKAIDAATSFLGSQVASFVVPNIVRGVATGMDNTVRNAYTGTDTQNAISSILSGIPFARKNLPASLTPFGKESTYTNNPWLNALNANLLPGGITKYKQEAVGAELERLSEATGETGVYPSKSAPSKIGEKELTAAQKDKYKITAGNAYYNAVNELLKDKSYNALNDADKTALVKSLIGYANDTAKREFVGNTYVSNDYAKVYDAEKAGIAPVSYFVFKSNLSKIDTNGSPTQVESTQAINQTNLSQADKGKLWNIQNSDASPNNNPYTGTLAQAKIPTNTTIAIMEFEATANADKDANGKSISGTKKKKVLDYAKSLGLNSLQINAVCTQYGWTPVTNYTSSSTGKFSMS